MNHHVLFCLKIHLLYASPFRRKDMKTIKLLFQTVGHLYQKMSHSVGNPPPQCFTILSFQLCFSFKTVSYVAMIVLLRKAKHLHFSDWNVRIKKYQNLKTKSLCSFTCITINTMDTLPVLLSSCQGDSEEHQHYSKFLEGHQLLPSPSVFW